MDLHSASPVAPLGSSSLSCPGSPAGTDEGGSHSPWQQKLPRPGRAPGQKEKHCTAGGEKNKVPQVPLHQLGTRCFSLSTACSQPLWAAGGHGAGPRTHAGSTGKLPSRSLSPQVRVKLFPQGQLCLSGRAHPAALQLSRRTKPLWGLEGLSHTARRVWGSLPVTILWRSGLGGCCAPERHKSPRRRSQRQMSL